MSESTEKCNGCKVDVCELNSILNEMVKKINDDRKAVVQEESVVISQNVVSGQGNTLVNPVPVNLYVIKHVLFGVVGDEKTEQFIVEDYKVIMCSSGEDYKILLCKKVGNILYIFCEDGWVFILGTHTIILSAEKSRSEKDIFEQGKVTFQGITTLEDVDFNHAVDTTEIDSMRGWFYGCNKLTKVDFSGVDSSNVTNMEGMFCECSELEDIDLSPLVISKVVSMRDMFWKCSKLQENTSIQKLSIHQSNKKNWLYDCSNMNLKMVEQGIAGQEELDSKKAYLDIWKLNQKLLNQTEEVKHVVFVKMDPCLIIANRIVGAFDTESIGMDKSDIYMGYLGGSKDTITISCEDDINIPPFNKINHLNIFELEHCMFRGCESLESVDFTGTIEIADIKTMKGWFYECKNLKKVNYEEFEVNKGEDASGIFWSMRETGRNKK